ncbi:MAG: hypothetical protein ABIR37_02055 [Candidatus Saccharimonadales bacterium]
MTDKKDGKNYSDGYLKFKHAMSGQHKDVAAVLNCHLVAEYFLEQIIHAQIPRADVLLTEGRLTFSNKLLLVKSLDVIDDKVIASLKGLNRVRNLCSHELEYKITDANVDLIGRPYGKEYIEVKREHPNDILKYTLMKPLARLDGCFQRIAPAKDPGK